MVLLAQLQKKLMFQFKQFNLIQENCPMKFGTDSMTLAGFVPIKKDVEHILDIGSGSGVIALIMAQRSKALIDAIEIDFSGFSDMKKNCEDSKWSNRLFPYHTSLQEFMPQTNYDLIISNPPYFTDSLKSNNQKKMTARHTSDLSFQEIAAFSKLHLSKSGQLAVILPETESQHFISACLNQELLLNHKISIKSFSHSKVIRNILIFGCSDEKKDDETIAIYKEKKVYTDEYEKMLSEYFITV